MTRALALALVLAPVFVLAPAAALAWRGEKSAAGAQLHWDGAAPTFSIGTAKNVRGDAGRALAAARDALQTWASPSGTAVAPRPACGVAAGVTVAWDDPWDAQYGSAQLIVGHTVLDADDATGALVSAAIHLNAEGFGWATDGQGGAIDVEAAAMHEGGHALGLAHPCGDAGAPACDSDPALAAAVMNPAPPLVARADLGVDDVAGIDAIAPAPAPAPWPAAPALAGCPTPASLVVDPSTVEAFVGDPCAPSASGSATAGRLALSSYPGDGARDVTVVAASGKRRTVSLDFAACAVPNPPGPGTKTGCGGLFAALLPLAFLRRRRWPAALSALAMVFTPSVSYAYNRSIVPDGTMCLFWAPRTLEFVTNDRCAPGVPLGACLDAVAKSFFAWTSPSCTDLAFVNGGTSSRRDVGYSPGANDNVNLVLWRSVACARAAPAADACWSDGTCANAYDCWDGSLHGDSTIAVTTTTFNRKTGQLVDADVELNAAPPASGTRFTFTVVDAPRCDEPGAPAPPGCVSTDVRNTVTHEAGHFLGLAHATDPSATMFASAAPGETSKRVLGDDDIAGICAIYPRGKPVVTCLSTNAIAITAQSASNGTCGGCAGGDAGFFAAGAALLLALRRRRAS